MNDALPKQQQFIGIPSAICFFGGACVTRRTPFAVMFDDDKDGVSNHQQKHRNGRYGALHALWRCCEIVLDQSTASTSVGQFSPKNGQAGPKHMNTRGNLIKGALCIWVLKCLGFWFALLGVRSAKVDTYVFELGQCRWQFIPVDCDSMESYWAYLAFYLNFG